MPFERSVWESRVGLAADGPNGVIQPQRVLEWMQDAAANASTLGGYPPQRYVDMGAAWFIKEVLLSIDRPIRYSDPIAIETWVSDLRRFRSRREYRVISGSNVVARGQADWLLLELDRATGKVRPLRVDAELSASFPRVPETVFAPGEIPEWGADPEVPQNLARDQRRVRPSELDRQLHVNHVVYLTWLEDHARLALGVEDELRTARIEYLLDARLGDEIELGGWIEGETVRQIATRGDKPILRAITRRTPAFG